VAKLLQLPNIISTNKKSDIKIVSYDLVIHRALAEARARIFGWCISAMMREAKGVPGISLRSVGALLDLEAALNGCLVSTYCLFNQYLELELLA